MRLPTGFPSSVGVGSMVSSPRMPPNCVKRPATSPCGEMQTVPIATAGCAGSAGAIGIVTLEKLPVATGFERPVAIVRPRSITSTWNEGRFR
jgi:hypothetical protein